MSNVSVRHLPRMGEQYQTLQRAQPQEIRWQTQGKTILGHVNWQLAESLLRCKEQEP